MNTKLLKQKILDLAIRGKLTQQLKSDGTALDLLKQISEQKRESSSTLSSPRRRGSSSAQSEKTIIPLDKSEAPFEIPANWEWVRLGDLCSKFSTGPFGTMLHKEDYVLEGGVPLVNPTNLQDGVIDSNKIKLVKKEKYESLRPYVLETNDIVLARRGDLSKCAIVSENENLWLAGTGAFFLKLVLVNVNYFIRLYRTSFVQSYLVADSIGSTMDNLNQTTLGNLPIPLPPLAEQQRIVAKIEEAFAEIDAIEKNKELLKTHIKQTRQKILDLAIHGKLVPQNKSDEPACVLLERITRDNPHYEKMGLDERRETKDERDSNYKRHSREGGNLPPMLSKDEVPFEVPENWCWCRLGDICNKLIDGDHNPPKGLDYVTKYMMLSSRNINDNDIVDLENVRYLSKEMFEEENQRTKLEEGDILFTSVGSLGRSCIFSGDGKYCFQRSVSLIHTNIYNKYLKYFFDSNFYQKYIVENATGTAQMGFYLEQMRKSFIAIPPLAEQSRIVAKIEELFAELDLVLQNV